MSKPLDTGRLRQLYCALPVAYPAANIPGYGTEPKNSRQYSAIITNIHTQRNNFQH